MGLQDYSDSWQAMRRFTDQRKPDTVSEIWLLQHPPVFTLGQAGKPEHILNSCEIPVVQSDRGGQVTYHGPGQLIVYLLINLQHAQTGVRGLVNSMENAVIELLGNYNITACSRADAPGVYVGDAKIAALGLRVRHGYTYHGLALNIDMNLSPYAQINPCGHVGQKITQTRSLGVPVNMQQTAHELVSLLAAKLNHFPIWTSND
jgi:lipoyl(octanoyl) transferase